MSIYRIPVKLNAEEKSIERGYKISSSILWLFGAAIFMFADASVTTVTLWWAAFGIIPALIYTVAGPYLALPNLETVGTGVVMSMVATVAIWIAYGLTLAGMSTVWAGAIILLTPLILRLNARR